MSISEIIKTWVTRLKAMLFVLSKSINVLQTCTSNTRYQMHLFNVLCRFEVFTTFWWFWIIFLENQISVHSRQIVWGLYGKTRLIFFCFLYFNYFAFIFCSLWMPEEMKFPNRIRNWFYGIMFLIMKMHARNGWRYADTGPKVI